MLRSLANIYRLGIKELFSLSRDVVLLFLIVYAFTYEVYGPAKNVSMEVENASIAIVDEDHSLVSQRISDAFLPPFFLRPARISVAEVDRAMDAGRYTFVIDIPPDFQRNVERGRRPALQVNVDATAMSQAGRGAEYIQQILTREIAEVIGHQDKRAALPVNLVVRVKFNPNLTSSWFMAVAQIVNSITLLAIFLCGAAVIREREHGTIEHLLVMPLRPVEIMSAKVWANGLVIVAGAMLSLLLVVRWGLQVPIAGSVSLFFGGTVLYVFAATALGIFLATLVRSMPQFGLLALPVYIVLHMLSGGMTPMESMPLTLQRIMHISPSTHFVRFAQAVLYRGAGIDLVWQECAAIALQGLIFFLIALARFRRMVVQVQANY
jgi:ABC-2 type transport system permease protein